MSDRTPSESDCATVLLVGASPRDARVVSCGLKREDIAVEIAADVRDAIDRLTAVSEDDASLPGLVALDFTRQPADSQTILTAIRASPRLRTLRTVALVSDTVPTDDARERIQRAYEHGVDGHVFSPGGVEEYADAVQRMAVVWFNHASLPPQSLYSDAPIVNYD
jgi:CheY-like chemotaxis protein